MEEREKVLRKIRKKSLTPKQRMALELLTSGKGYKYKEVCDIVGIDNKTLWRWRNEPGFAHFQAEYNRLNDEIWYATVDAARESAFNLCRDGNQRMVEFVLKNEGYNPTQKVEADVSNDINITIE